jgi:predicted transcriptional regulator
MTNRPKGMTEEEIALFLKRMDEAPNKKKAIFSFREVTAAHRERILNFMAKKGYTYQDVADLMASEGEGVSGVSVSSYLRGSKTQAPIPKKKRPRAAKGKTPDTKSPDIEKVSEVRKPSEAIPTAPLTGIEKFKMLGGIDGVDF